MVNLFIIFFRTAIIAVALPYYLNTGYGDTIEHLRIKSYEGDCEARYQLAILLEKGEGIKRDMSEALSLLKEAADEEDHKNAKSKLYSLLNELKSKASGGDSESQYLLGNHLFYGEESETKEGFQWLLKAAERGHSGAQYDVGLILLGEYTNEACVQSYFNGSGRTKHLNWNNIKQLHAEHVIPTNTLKGHEWLQKSAESKNIEAMKYLFQAYIQGRNYIPRNYEKAYKLAQERLKLKDPAAAMSLGAMYFKGVGVKPNSEKALEYWNMASNMGLEGAKFFLAQQYNPNIWENLDYMGKKTEFTGADGWEDFEYEGPMWFLEDGAKVVVNGIRKPDEAVKLLQEIVKNHDEYGYPNDEYENALGNAYFIGEGVEQDYQEAIKWWEKAAIKRPGNLIGNTDALYHLGMAYKNGHGVNRDMEKAIQYFEMSAKFHQKNSQRELLVIYDQQIKSPKDFLAKAKSVEIWDEIIWEFLGQKSSKFNKVKEEGYSLDQVFEFLAEKNWTIDDIIKPVAKQALLIANSNYLKFGGLANTGPDAQKLAKVLEAFGFETTIVENASREEMLDALKSFENKVRGTEAIAFFHYGGHGVQVDGKNYLIPADAEIPDERRVATRAVDLDEVIASIEMAKPKASVLVVDACRHNPLPASPTRAATRGLAVVGRKPKNSVIIFAAEAGNEALDGLFTPIFAKNLQQYSDKSLNQIMQKVRAEVFEKSNGSQTPGEYNQLFDELFFESMPET
jgi:TPR repeat protein